LEAAHLIPHSAAERLGLPQDDVLQEIAFSYESTLNAVSACVLCHKLFDLGVLWLGPRTAVAGSSAAASVHVASASAVDAEAEAALVFDQLRSLVVHVDSTWAAENGDPYSFNQRKPQLPKALHAFPRPSVWEWRVRWAELKRAQTDEPGTPGL